MGSTGKPLCAREKDHDYRPLVWIKGPELARARVTPRIRPKGEMHLEANLADSVDLSRFTVAPKFGGEAHAQGRQGRHAHAREPVTWKPWSCQHRGMYPYVKK